MDYSVMDAIQAAHDAHLGEVDRSGAPYIWHVTRVVGMVCSTDERIVAALHDVYEHGHDVWAPEHLRHSLDLITRKDTDTYAEYIQKLKHDPIARRVKIADIKDHLFDWDSLPLSLASRYIKAYHVLKEVEDGPQEKG